MPARKPRKAGHGIEFRKQIDGRRVSKTFHDRKAGEAWLREHVTRTERGQVSLPTDTTLAEAFAQFIEQRGPALAPATKKLYASFWSEHLSPEFGDQVLAGIRTPDLQAWIGRLLERRKAAGSVHRITNLLRAVFNLAKDAGQVQANPCDGLKMPPARKVRETRMYTDDELELILEACTSPRLRALVLVALGTGMRRGEMMAMRWSWLDTGREVIRIPASIEAGFVPKGRRFREVNLGPDVRAALKAWMPEKLRAPDAQVFPGGNINRWQRLIRSNTGRLRAEARGIDLPSRGAARRELIASLAVPFRWHMLRHTAISRMVEAGVKLRSVMEISGHTSMRMLEVYSHLAPDGALAELRDKLPRGIGGERPARRRLKAAPGAARR
jgi:integrase